MKPWCSLAALICKRCSKSQERAEPGAALSLRLSSLANPPTQRKVRVFSTNRQFVLLILQWFSLFRYFSSLPLLVDAYISLEGEGFMEMRVKHLEKMGELAKAVVLAKACTECCFVSNQATFRQTYVSLLCHLLPNEEAIMEVWLHL